MAQQHKMCEINRELIGSVANQLVGCIKLGHINILVASPEGTEPIGRLPGLTTEQTTLWREELDSSSPSLDSSPD